MYFDHISGHRLQKQSWFHNHKTTENTSRAHKMIVRSLKHSLHGISSGDCHDRRPKVGRDRNVADRDILSILAALILQTWDRFLDAVLFWNGEFQENKPPSPKPLPSLKSSGSIGEASSQKNIIPKPLTVPNGNLLGQKSITTVVSDGENTISSFIFPISDPRNTANTKP